MLTTGPLPWSDLHSTSSFSVGRFEVHTYLLSVHMTSMKLPPPPSCLNKVLIYILASCLLLYVEGGKSDENFISKCFSCKRSCAAISSTWSRISWDLKYSFRAPPFLGNATTSDRHWRCLFLLPRTRRLSTLSIKQGKVVGIKVAISVRYRLLMAISNSLGTWRTKWENFNHHCHGQ